MATVETNTDVFEKAWEGFKELIGKKSKCVSLHCKQTTTALDGDESFLETN